MLWIDQLDVLHCRGLPASFTTDEARQQQTTALPDPTILLGDRPLSICRSNGIRALSNGAVVCSNQQNGPYQQDSLSAQKTAVEQQGSNPSKHAAPAVADTWPERVRSFPHVEGNFPTVVYVPGKQVWLTHLS